MKITEKQIEALKTILEYLEKEPSIKEKYEATIKWLYEDSELVAIYKKHGWAKLSSNIWTEGLILKDFLKDK